MTTDKLLNIAPALASKIVFAGILLISAIMTGCFPDGATTVMRPSVDVSPWQELTVKSSDSGSTYNYMYLEGPSKDAPVLVLLHGGIFDNRIWMYTDKLGRKFNVYAPMYPDNSLFYTGHVEDWGRVVTDFVKTVDIKPDYMAAVSNGAYGAIEYLIQNPDNSVKGLALISTVMFSVSDEEIKKRTRMADFALGRSPGKLLGIVEKKAGSAEFSDAPGSVNQHDIFYVRPYPYFYEVFGVPKNQGRKKQNTMSIKIPVIVLHGTADKIMPIHAARLTTGVFPNAGFKQFEDKGHDMVFSDGPEIADALLSQFTK